MYDYAPHQLTPEEWQELAEIELVREAWGLEDGEDGVQLIERGIYGVRFDFVCGSPGYVGPLYLLMGDGDPCQPPVNIVRQDGRLVVEAY